MHCVGSFPIFGIHKSPIGPSAFYPDKYQCARRHRRELAAARGKNFRWGPGSFKSKPD